MFPILFRVPMPHMPLKLWWALAAIAVLALLYAAFAHRRAETGPRNLSFGVAIAAGVAGYLLRDKSYEAPNLPIYSYGVMLGLSLVVGWYLTLALSKRDKLPEDTMANCYVISALVALIGARLLYIATNPSEFKELADVFALRRGGLVAYGGFTAGFFGSWLYLRREKIKLLAWGDVAAPSLAAGLVITRIGCYLFGCDYGRRLSEGAPSFLKKLGTFPHWTGAALDAGDGSPAFVRHRDLFMGTPLGADVMRNNASLPVHPTQIYEAFAGVVLLGFLMWQRKHSKFKGQTFFSLVFGYGAFRFLIELLRDDPERGDFGPILAQHVLIPFCILLFALAFIFRIAIVIDNPHVRTAARVIALLPALVAYLLLRPASFAGTVDMQLSTSQWLALITGLHAAFFFGRTYIRTQNKRLAKAARKKKFAEKSVGPEEAGEASEEESAQDTTDEEPAPAK